MRARMGSFGNDDRRLGKWQGGDTLNASVDQEEEEQEGGDSRACL